MKGKHLYGNVQAQHIIGPQVDVLVSSPIDDKMGKIIPGIVDSGATITCIPVGEIEDLGGGQDLVVMPRMVKKGNDIITQQQPVYIVNMEIAGCQFNNHEVIATKRKYILIGRDILNDYSIRFDGPGREWEAV